MASKKKGVIVLKKNNTLKVTYSHRNSEMRLVGKRTVKWIRSAGVDAISDYYDKVIMIKEETPMTEEQKESYKKYIPEQLWPETEHMTWQEALAWTKDAVSPLKAFYPYMVDYSGFVGAWANRWRYIIDLDNNLFIVVRAGLEMLLFDSCDTYPPEYDWMGKVAHTEIGRFPLDNIPEDWIEQCDKYWKSLMIIAVDYSHNKEAMDSEHVQEMGVNGYNPADSDWEKIKFYYGQNSYNKMITDM
mgnify:FL=1